MILVIIIILDISYLFRYIINIITWGIYYKIGILLLISEYIFLWYSRKPFIYFHSFILLHNLVYVYNGIIAIKLNPYYIDILNDNSL